MTMTHDVGSAWSYTQDQRDEAVEIADCSFCGQVAGDPCLILAPYRKDTGELYDRYVHLPRIEAVFPDKPTQQT